jgi:hypothetical protein
MQQATIEAFLAGRMNQHTLVDQPATIQPAKDQQPVTRPLSSTSGVRVSFLPSFDCAATFPKFLTSLMVLLTWWKDMGVHENLHEGLEKELLIL